MQSFMIALLTCSITMSVLALLYMAITPQLSKRYSAKGRYYTWLIIIVGLIIPFRPQFNNSVVTVDVPQELSLPFVQLGNGTPAIDPVSTASLPAIASSISMWQILIIIWLAGAFFFLVYHAIMHYRFVKLVGRWSENIKDEKIIFVLNSLKAEMGISKNINVQLCASAGSPMMIGFSYPQILLPQIDFAPDELRFILAHELVHYKRKDLWYKMLTLLATAIHWFNPIVYLIAKEIDIQCELSCDNEVIRHTDAETRQHYSEAIIGVVRYQSKMKTTLSTNFYGGKKGMKKRIFSIMETGKKRSGIALICVVLLLSMSTGMAFVVNAATTPEYSGTTRQQSTSSVTQENRAAEQAVDLSIYEEYGMSYDTSTGKYYYAGEQVRFFYDAVAGVSFNNFRTGKVDIEAEYEHGTLTGLKYSSQEDYEMRSVRYSDIINSTTSPAPNVPQENNAQNTLNSYTQYGLYYSNGIWEYNSEQVRTLIDNNYIYFSDNDGVNLQLIRNNDGSFKQFNVLTNEEAGEMLNNRPAINDDNFTMER